jgi:hypothetical protein
MEFPSERLCIHEGCYDFEKVDNLGDKLLSMIILYIVNLSIFEACE